MNMKRAILVLLTVFLVTAFFIPTVFAEGEGVQIVGESAEQTEQPSEQASEPLCESPSESPGELPNGFPSEPPSESVGNQSNEEVTCFTVEFRDWEGLQ